MTEPLKIGFMPLTDCATLVVASAHGWFEAEGLKVELVREVSWSNIRDKVAAGLLDGAHMLAPMPLASTLGLGGQPAEMITPLTLSLNGNAITVSPDLHAQMLALDPRAVRERLRGARALKAVVERRRAEGLPPLTFAAPFPFSCHNYELRWWLSAGGIDPDREVRLLVLPPQRMAAMLKAGEVDGYCVGDPWNSLAARGGFGVILAASYELWPAKPEKVFGMTRAFAEADPDRTQALIRALIKAARWADAAENRSELARLIVEGGYVDADLETVRGSLVGEPPFPAVAGRPGPDFVVFHRYAATFPWLSHAHWQLAQMLRWGQIDSAVDLAAVTAAVYRPDLWRAAAAAIGEPAPTADSKVEGVHAAPWTIRGERGDIAMPADRFFAGGAFDPARTLEHLSSFDIVRMKVTLEALAEANG